MNCLVCKKPVSTTMVVEFTDEPKCTQTVGICSTCVPEAMKRIAAAFRNEVRKATAN